MNNSDQVVSKSLQLLHIYAALFTSFAGVTLLTFGWFTQMRDAETILGNAANLGINRRLMMVGSGGAPYIPGDQSWDFFYHAVTNYSTTALALIISGIIITATSTGYLAYMKRSTLIAAIMLLIIELCAPIGLACSSGNTFGSAIPLFATECISGIASICFIVSLARIDIPMTDDSGFKILGKSLVCIAVFVFSGFLLIASLTHVLFGVLFASAQLAASFGLTALGVVSLAVSHWRYLKRVSHESLVKS